MPDTGVTLPDSTTGGSGVVIPPTTGGEWGLLTWKAALPRRSSEEPSPGVRLITINRAEARNAIGPVEAGALFDFVGRFRDDEDANVLVITGAGTEAFCAGADLKSVVAMFDPNSDLEPLYDGSDLNARPIPAEGNIGPTRWTGIGKPVIAAVNGAACRRARVGLPRTHQGGRPACVVRGHLPPLERRPG